MGYQEMVIGQGTIAFFAAIISMVILYFIIKAAVKNGIIEASKKMGWQMSSVIDVADDVSEKDIVICKRCGSFKKLDGFCPDCRSGRTGKKVSKDIWNALNKMSEEQERSVKAVLPEMAVCKNCGSLKKKGAPCPKCGNVRQ